MCHPSIIEDRPSRNDHRLVVNIDNGPLTCCCVASEASELATVSIIDNCCCHARLFGDDRERDGRPA